MRVPDERPVASSMLPGIFSVLSPGGKTGVLLIGVALASSVGTTVAQDAERPVTVETIWQVFAERQAAAQTADVNWLRKDKQLVGRAARRGGGPRRQGGAMPRQVAFPEHECRIVLAGDRIRDESMTISVIGKPEGEIVRTISTFNGTTEQRYTKATDGTPASGEVVSRDKFFAWSLASYKPLLLALRPLRPEVLGESPEHWTIRDGTFPIDGHDCIMLVDAAPGGKSERYLYIDVANGYLPRRMTKEAGGAPTFQIDMHYERRDDPKWIPSSWKTTLNYFGQQGSFAQAENELVSVELGLAVPDETFEIDFPPGTELTTVIDGKDELKKVSTSGEFVPARLATAEATPAVASSWWPWIAGGLGFAALALAASLLWRRAARIKE